MLVGPIFKFFREFSGGELLPTAVVRNIGDTDHRENLQNSQYFPEIHNIHDRDLLGKPSQI